MYLKSDRILSRPGLSASGKCGWATSGSTYYTHVRRETLISHGGKAYTFRIRTVRAAVDPLSQSCE